MAEEWPFQSRGAAANNLHRERERLMEVWRKKATYLSVSWPLGVVAADNHDARICKSVPSKGVADYEGMEPDSEINRECDDELPRQYPHEKKHQPGTQIQQKRTGQNLSRFQSGQEVPR